MRLPYTAVPSAQPLPSLGGSQVRYRTIAVVRAAGPSGTIVRDALLDSGADDTVFPESTAALLGVDLSAAPSITVNLAGRGPVLCRYAQVTLWLSDNISEAYEWEATVGFTPIQHLIPLLGHAGSLQFFDVGLLGADREYTLLPNRSFTGRII